MPFKLLDDRPDGREIWKEQTSAWSWWDARYYCACGRPLSVVTQRDNETDRSFSQHAGTLAEEVYERQTWSCPKRRWWDVLGIFHSQIDVRRHARSRTYRWEE
jgi:hypothetical protein